MATKLYDLQQTVAVPNGAGLTFDPLLMEPVLGVDTLVPPDIVIPVPKAAAASAAVTTAMAVGNQTVVHNNAGPINFDILTIRLHTIQRSFLAMIGLAANPNRYVDIEQAVAIANGAGTAINPLLTLAGVAAVPSIVIPVPKTVPTLATDQSFVATVLAAGAITIQHAEAAPVNHDILFVTWHTIQLLTQALFGDGQDERRYFTILDGAAASKGAVYEDDDDPTRQFRVDIAKVALDGSLLLTTTQIAGTTAPTTGGADNLSLVSGTGDANIAYTGVRFEKLMHLLQNTAVPNGAGLTFDPGLVENGTPVMPDIVIPVPKVTGIVPFVATDLTGPVGTVNVSHNGGAPANCDILAIRAHSIFRDV